MLNQILTLTRSLIVFDLETTGVDTQRDRIVQFGMTVHRPDREPEEYHTLINPGCEIPEDAREAHGISNAIIAHGCARCLSIEEEHPNSECDRFRPVPRFRDIADHLYKGFGNADFGGYNCMRFDLPLIMEEFDRIGLFFDVSQSYVLDALRMWQVMEPRTLTDAMGVFADKTLEGAHHAMIDVRATNEVLAGMLAGKRFSRLPDQRAASNPLPKTPKEIHELIWSPDRIDLTGKFKFNEHGVPCFAFGKNDGRPIQGDTGYLRWMLGQSFPADVRRICQAALGGNLPQQRQLLLEDK